MVRTRSFSQPINFIWALLLWALLLALVIVPFVSDLRSAQADIFPPCWFQRIWMDDQCHILVVYTPSYRVPLTLGGSPAPGAPAGGTAGTAGTGTAGSAAAGSAAADSAAGTGPAGTAGMGNMGGAQD